MNTKKITLMALLPFICFSSISQLVSVKTVDPQKSTFKTLGTGLNLNTYYDDDNIRYYQFHDVIECVDGFYKVGLSNNSGYQKKKNLSIHVIKMDKALQISREFDIELKSQQNSAHVTPFALYRNGNRIELLANNRKDGMLNIMNWEFNLADFSLISQDNVIGGFSIPENSYCDFSYNINEKTFFGGISFLERKGKKSKECAVHSLSWNSNMKRVSQQSTEMNRPYDQDMLSEIKTTASGETWTLLDSRTRNESIGTSIFYMGENKGKLTEVLKNNTAVTGAGLALANANSGVFVAGYTSTSGATVSESLCLAALDKNGKLVTSNEYVLPESFIDKTTNFEKNTRERKSLSKNYSVREILVRENNTIDVIATLIRLDEGLTPSGPYTKTQIGDVHIYSFVGDKLVSTICINRNIRDIQNGELLMSVTKDFSIPFVYTQQDNLVILCVANSGSFSGSNNSNLDDQYISEAQFVAVKIDNQFKLKKQVIYDLSEKTKGFETYRQITLRRINTGQFFGYNETEFGMTTKAKLTFSHIKVR